MGKVGICGVGDMDCRSHFDGMEIIWSVSGVFFFFELLLFAWLLCCYYWIG